MTRAAADGLEAGSGPGDAAAGVPPAPVAGRRDLLTATATRLLARLGADPAVTAVAVTAALATFLFVHNDQHAPYDITPGEVARFLAWASPGVSAAAAALAVMAPWPGLLLVTLLTPYWDAAQVGWTSGPVQVTLTTLFTGALLLGCAFEARRGATLIRLSRFPRALAVAGAILILATASTLASPDMVASGPVWLHGVVEPVVLAVLVLLLAPGVRGIALLALALALSVALGSVINIVQSLPLFGSLAAFQLHGREFFARLTYFNVGLFGEVLSMAVPLLAGLLVARRRVGLRPWQSAVVLVALGVTIVATYLTFQKSGWLGTGTGLLVLLLALLPTGRLRFAALATVILLSALVVPWPEALLRPVAPGLADDYRHLLVAIEGTDRVRSWDPFTPQGEVSVIERARATAAALRMAVDHPLLGVGLDRFGPNYAGFYRDPQATRQLASAHDFLPNIAAELGLVVAGLVALAMAAALVAAWRTWHRPRDGLARAMAAMVGAGLAAWWVVSATFDPDLYRTWRLMSSDIIFAAMLVAMAVALEAAGRRRTEEPPRG